MYHSAVVIGMIAQAGLKTCTSREEIVELLANAKSLAYTGERTSGKTFLAVAERDDLSCRRNPSREQRRCRQHSR
jgi:hypothetical protein